MKKTDEKIQKTEKTEKKKSGIAKFLPSVVMFAVFETVAVSLWLSLDNLFYLLNFSYIGACIAIGLALFAGGWKHARRFVQFAVGSYMLV